MNMDFKIIVLNQTFKLKQDITHLFSNEDIFYIFEKKRKKNYEKNFFFLFMYVYEIIDILMKKTE